MHDIYHPAEDSHLLAKVVEKRARGLVLDMGTGSGIQAEIAAAKAVKVVAVDINKHAVDEFRKKTAINSNIEIRQSDLFSAVDGKFDLIIFNPPYLPNDKRIKDVALDGGRKGHELIARFLQDAPNHLKDDGEILLLFSSHTGKERIDRIILEYSLISETLAEQRIFFENLYVYSIRKSSLRKRIESLGVCNMKFLARGQRGLIFTGIYHGKKVAIKCKNPLSKAVGKIAHEAEMLKKVNSAGIGPKFILYEPDILVYEFAEGVIIKDLIKQKRNVSKIFEEVMRQMEILDGMGITKQEMTNPYKHIIISNEGKATLIDFERARFTKKPHNVSQFKEFIKKTEGRK
mgnify:CR=1 FL=1